MLRNDTTSVFLRLPYVKAKIKFQKVTRPIILKKRDDCRAALDRSRDRESGKQLVLIKALRHR